MRAFSRRARHWLTAVTAAACTATMAGLSAVPAVAGSVARADARAAVPGSQLWASRYNGPGNGFDGASSVAVSPRGGTVFVTGRSWEGFTTSLDYATVAYNSVTGAQLWASRYNGPGNNSDLALALAVSPDGRTVFVTGASFGATSGQDYATVAYNAATGAQRWVSRYNGPANGNDLAYSLAVSPGGATVFVTGQSTSATSSVYATVAYNAATGAQRWVSRYSGPRNLSIAHALAVSPRGHTVFVTGESIGANSGHDYATVAYNAATGARRWVSRYNGRANRADVALAVAVSPSGRTVFVTGQSHGATSDYDYATVAYRAATGARRWVSRYNGPGNGSDIANAVAVSPGGRTVFVTGASAGTTGFFTQDYATIAYNAATGAPRWVRRYNGPFRTNDFAFSIAVSPQGGAVFVTGFSQRSRRGSGQFRDYATVAYAATTGGLLWASRYSGPSRQSGATSVAVSPDGTKVFVTGSSVGNSGTAGDYATVAYRG